MSTNEHQKLSPINTDASARWIQDRNNRATLAQTVQWLHEAGVSTSASAVSQFLRWCNHRQELARNEQALRNAILDLIRQGSVPTAESLSQIGNTIFAASALEKQDHRAWHMSQQIALRKTELDLKSKQLTQN